MATATFQTGCLPRRGRCAFVSELLLEMVTICLGLHLR